MNPIRTLICRRQFLLATGAASAGALTTRTAIAAGKAATAACSNGAKPATTIKGVVVEKPVYKELSLEELLAGFGVTAGPGGAAGSPPGAAAGALPGAPAGAAFGAPSNATPGVYVDNGKYLPDNSRAGVVSAGKVGDAFASGVKIDTKDAQVGGVYVKGLGTEYILADADIVLEGDGGGLGGANCGAAADDYARLTIRNCTITTSGKSKNATSVQNHGVLKVYNSTLKANGAPFTPDLTSTDQKKQLEIDGNSRTHITLSNSYSYFYYSTIIAEGWAALSTDGSEGFVYLEANHCKVQTIKSGYGTYADWMCHNFINCCDFDVAAMTAILAGQADIAFRDTKAKCGSYFALIHCVGAAAQVSTLKVTGGEIACKDAAVLVKSANAEILFEGAKVSSENGILLKSVKSVDPNAAKAANTKGQKVYGIHATFKDMDVTGDIDHSLDKENRSMTVYLESTTLKGAIKDASIKMDQFSKWVATTDSNVTIVGNVDVSQIDAPAGVTITAVAAVGGKYALASCGTLVLKTA
jgi:hypothetical protein